MRCNSFHVHVCVCVEGGGGNWGAACASEHNVPSIHGSPLAKPDGVHQSESPSRTT